MCIISLTNKIIALSIIPSMFVFPCLPMTHLTTTIISLNTYFFAATLQIWARNWLWIFTVSPIQATTAEYGPISWTVKMEPLSLGTKCMKHAENSLSTFTIKVNILLDHPCNFQVSEVCSYHRSNKTRFLYKL